MYDATFMKYNFNLPKRAPEPYGYHDDMESWEFQNNTSNLMLFKSDYFDETMYTDPNTGQTKERWRYDYEARFPSDEWVDYTKLQEFQSFVYSTDRKSATNQNLQTPATYFGTTYTQDTPAYRLAKFKAEFGDYAQVSSFIFYYIFTQFFLMVDSRAKNLFIGFSGSATNPSKVHYIDRKAVAEPYDMDTAIGTNNQGALVFGYSYEDTDYLSGGDIVFNGQDSVLWNNIRDSFGTEIQQMYQTLRSGRILSYDEVEKRFDDHQAKWPEAVWLEDAMFKYIDPLISPDPGKEPTDVYLPMLQGSKKGQRKWWLSNRFKYMDSKWNAGDAVSQRIQLRGYAKSDITVTPYADIYPAVQYGSYWVYERGKQGQPTLLPCPIDTLNDTEIYILSAPQIASVGDLSGLNVGFADFSAGTKLQSIKLGDSSVDYENTRLNYLSLGNNRLLSTLDLRNCVALGTGSSTDLDLSGCPNLQEIYLDGTKLTGVTLPVGGIVNTLHLPDTISLLSIRNQQNISDFKISYLDEFTGDGTTTQFTLKQSPSSITYVRAYYDDTFTGDGHTTTFTLSHAPTRVNSVYLGAELTTDFAVSGNQITFTVAPQNQTVIHIEYFNTIIGYTLSNNKITLSNAPADGIQIRVASIGTIPTNIASLRIQNSSPVIDTQTILMNLNNRTPIRLLGVNWSVADQTKAWNVYDKLQAMRGIDSTGLNIDKAVVSGVLSIPSPDDGIIIMPEIITAMFPYFSGSEIQLQFGCVPIILDVKVGNVSVQYHVVGNTLILDDGPYNNVTVYVSYYRDLYNSFAEFYPDLYLRIGGVIRFKVRYYAENGETPLQCGVDEHGNPVYQLIIPEGGNAPDPIKQAHNQNFDGDGTETSFTLRNEPTSITSVTIDGVEKTAGTDYSVSGDTVTFTVAPANNSYVLISYVTGYIDVPTKQGDAQYHYTYIGWDNDNNNTLQNVHANMNYVQTFDQILNQYTVYFHNDDGTPLYTTVVNYGEQAIYEGSENPPRKTNVDHPEDWTFIGWSQSVSFVTHTMSVYATYASPIHVEQIEDSWTEIMSNSNNRHTETFTGNGSTTRFTLSFTPSEILSLTVDGVENSNYTLNLNAITFAAAPEQNEVVLVKYRTRSAYPVGSYKTLTLKDGSELTMQIVGINEDQLSDGSDTAQYSWISMDLFPTMQSFNDKFKQGIGQFVYDQSTGIWTSDIAGKPFYNAIGTWTITVSGSGTMTMRYMISSETTHDYGNIFIDGTQVVNRISGQTTWVEREMAVTNGQVITVYAVYHKDINQNAGSDSMYLRFVPSSGVSLSTEYEGTNSIPDKGGIGGFDGMKIYTYLNEDIKNLLPDELKNNVKAVKKYTRSLISNGSEITSYRDRQSDPEIWIPSLREMGFLINSYQTKGPVYNSVYYNNTTRKKYSSNSSEVGVYYWLRSQYTDESISCVTSLGDDGGLSADAEVLFPLCFCT